MKSAAARSWTKAWILFNDRMQQIVVTPLTEQKSANFHDETNACDRVQHALFRAVVGKLQDINGVRPDLLFATKCLSYKIASPTLADVTRAKKVLRYLKGTRELNDDTCIDTE